MKRQFFLPVFLFFMAHAAFSMHATGIMAGCNKIFRVWSSPLTTCPHQAEKALQKAVAEHPMLNYRLALCKRLLKRDRKEILPTAALAAQEDKSGLAQYFYGILLQEEDDWSSRMWFERAAKNGIGWEEFIRDEQLQLHGDR